MTARKSVMGQLVRLISILFWLVFALFLIDFAIGNRAEVFVVLRALRVAVPMPVYMVFFIGILTGVLLAVIATSGHRFKRFVERRQAERALKVTKAENESLRETVHAQGENQSKITAREEGDIRPPTSLT